MAGIDTAGNAAGQAAVTRALVRLGLLRGDEAPSFTRLAGGVSSDIWRVDLPQRAGVRQARLAQAPGGRRTGSRRSSATPTRRPGCAVRRRSCPRRCRALLGQDRARRAFWSWRISIRRATGCGRPTCATAMPIQRSRASVGERLARIHAATADDPDVAAAVRHRPDLLRHPARAVSGRDRAARIRIGPMRCTRWSRPPRATGAPSCTATSAPRTS